MKHMLTAACTAAFAAVCPTLAQAVTIGGSSVTHKVSFSFTETELLASPYTPLTFALPKAKSKRKLVAAEWSVDYSAESIVTIWIPSPCGPYDEYTEICEGDSWRSVYLDLFPPVNFLEEDDLGFSLHYYEDYVFVPSDFEGEWYYGYDTSEGTIGPFSIQSLSGLAGAGNHVFRIDKFEDNGGFEARQVLLTGTASITYTYAPIPLPAALPLMLGAIGAMGLAARRRRR